MQTLHLSLTPEEGFSPELLQLAVIRHLGLSITDVVQVELLRRSIDARSRQVKIQVQVNVAINETLPLSKIERPAYKNVKNAKSKIDNDYYIFEYINKQDIPVNSEVIYGKIGPKIKYKKNENNSYSCEYIFKVCNHKKSP